MDNSWLDDDDELLAELGLAMRAADEMPDRFVRAGRAAFEWRGVDAELARLLADTAAALPGPALPGDSDHREVEPAGAGLRAGPARVRSLTFAASRITVEVDLQPDGLRGQVFPAQAGEVGLHHLESDDPVLTVPIDEVGWFVITPAPAGTIRLSVQAAGQTAVTSWFTV